MFIGHLNSCHILHIIMGIIPVYWEDEITSFHRHSSFCSRSYYGTGAPRKVAIPSLSRWASHNYFLDAKPKVPLSSCFCWWQCTDSTFLVTVIMKYEIQLIKDRNTTTRELKTWLDSLFRCNIRSYFRILKVEDLDPRYPQVSKRNPM